MAGNSTISISFKLDGDSRGFRDLAKDADGLKAAISQTVGESVKMKKSLMNWSLSVQGIEAVSSAVGQLNGVIQGAIAPSAGFNSAMRETNTMAGKGAKEFEEMKDKVNALSKRVPILRDQLAKGLYQVISNGVPEDNWITFLEKSARSSVGGIANLEKVVTVTSTVIKNYGLEWAAAGDVQDKIQLTAKNGVTSFEQLAEALPRVTGSAATLGVQLDELLAVFATATGVTGNTAEVSTQLAAVLNALQKPSSMAATAAKEMGIEFDAASVKAAGGLQKFLVHLDEDITEYAAKTGKLKETIYATLFGSAESLRLLTSLTGQQADTFTTNIGAMADSMGTMDAAFAQTAKKGSSFKQMLKNNTSGLSDLTAELMGGAAPLLDFGASAGMTAMSIATLSKTMKYNGLVMKANAALTKVATATVKRFTISAKGADVAVKATSRSVKVLKIAMSGIAAAGIVVALDAVASALMEMGDNADEATEKQKELAEEAAKRKHALTDIGAAAAEGAKKEIAALDRLYKAATNEKAAREKRTAAIREMQRQYPKYFANIDAERVNVSTLTSRYNDLRDSILNTARARAAEGKIEENAGQQLDLEMKMGDNDKKVNALRKQLESVTASAGRATKAYEELRKKSEKAILTGAEMDKYQAAYSKYTTEVARREELQEKLNAAMSAGNDLAKQHGEIARANAKLEAIVKGTGTTVKNTPTATPSGTKGTAATPPAKWHEMPTTIRQIDENLGILHEKLLDTDKDGAAAINRQIALLRAAKEEIQNMGKAAEESAPVAEAAAEEKVVAVLNVKAATLQDIENNISILQDRRQTASMEEVAGLNREIDMWTRKADAIRNAGREADKESMKVSEGLRSGWNGVKKIGGGIDSITTSLKGSGNVWQKVTGIVDGFINVYDGISEVAGIIQLLTAASMQHTTVKGMEGGAEIAASGMRTTAAAEDVASSVAIIAANKAEAASFRELAASKFFAAHASIPFAGFALGAGFTSAMIAAVAAAGIPMLAEGGIAAGPTLAMVGEYPGAGHNPEIIAPLDKLRNMLSDSNGNGGGNVRFEIEGRKLVGILTKEGNLRNRS